MLSDGCRVSFGGNTVRISSGHPAISKAIDLHFAHCTSTAGQIIADYHIAAISETTFSISVDGSVLSPRLSFEQVLWHLTQEALAHLNGNCMIGPVFHAAALEQAGRSVILCGQSGSGKSSLAAWLVAKGFRYLTDEVILYSPNSTEISGFARSLILKAGSAFIWQRWLRKVNEDQFISFADGSAWIDPCLFNTDGISTQAKPGLLIFPQYTPGATFSVKKLSTAETLFSLLQNLVNARNLPGHGLVDATSFARQVKAFSLRYSDIESSTEWIRQTTLTH